MKACIYARTSRVERLHTTTSIENQVAICRELAWKHNFQVDQAHVFTDREMLGSLPPSNWVFDNAPSRPALGALLEQLEEQAFTRVIVRRFEKLGTTSEVLSGLCELFQARGVRVISCPEQLAEPDNHTGRFAAAILRPVIQFDTDAERERKQRIRAEKMEEVRRLQDKIHRLEAEIAELD